MSIVERSNAHPLATRAGFLILLAALALMPDDSPTPLKGQPVGRKHVAWCDPVPLDEVKAIGKGLNCSVNDVLLSCAAGAIGRYLRARKAAELVLAREDVLRGVAEHPLGHATTLRAVADSAGNISHLNPAAELLTGFARTAAVGLPIEAVLPLRSDATTDDGHPVRTALRSPGAPLRLSGRRASVHWQAVWWFTRRCRASVSRMRTWRCLTSTMPSSTNFEKVRLTVSSLRPR